MMGTYWNALVVGWVVLAAVVIVLAVERWWVSRKEDDSIHVADGTEGAINEQVAVASTLNRIERWGKVLTIITVVTGLALASLYLYNTFVSYQDSLLR